MDAEIRTLSKIFQGDVQFLVPMFQRPYVWNQSVVPRPPGPAEELTDLITGPAAGVALPT